MFCENQPITSKDMMFSKWCTEKEIYNGHVPARCLLTVSLCGKRSFRILKKFFPN